MGSPVGRESYGDRVARSSRRSHDRPGRTGRPSAGRRGTGDRILQPGGMRNCRAPKRYWVSSATVAGGLPCNELYRQMFNRDLYLLAYGRIYANQGAMTPGTSAETADGMSEDK